MASNDDILQFEVKWRNRTINLSLFNDDTVGKLKKQLEIQTGVPTHLQKLFITGLSTVPSDLATFSSLKISKSPIKVLLIGSKQEEIEQHLTNIKIQNTQNIENLDFQQDITGMDPPIQEIFEEPMELIEQQDQQLISDQREDFSRAELVSSTAERTGYIEFILKCYSFVFSHKPDLSEVGDKVILPTSKLNDFETSRIPFPFIFQLVPLSSTDNTNKPEKEDNNQTNTTNNTNDEENLKRQTHCGVLDFTAPDEIAYLPHHMMQKLGIDEGDFVLFRSVILPQGKFARFQPQSLQWIEISENERRQILESQLRKYSTLTLHDLIVIEHQNVTYNFTVLELKPNFAVSILDSDLEVDIEEPTELQKIQITPLEWNKPTQFDLSSKNYFTFFSINVEDPQTTMTIKLVPEQGTAAFYVSTVRKYPNKSGFQWSSEPQYSPTSGRSGLLSSIDGSKTLVIDQSDPSFVVGTYYIGVYCLFTNFCKGTLIVTNTKAQDQHTLRNAEKQTQQDTSQCPNCLKQIPKQSYTLHTLQCAKRNWVCDQCGKVIPFPDKQKHIQAIHTKFKCECGFEGEQDLLQLHKQYECRFRPFKCPYCDVEIRWSERGEHLKSCGSRTTTCQYCNKIYKFNELRLHEESEHPNLLKSKEDPQQ